MFLAIMIVLGCLVSTVMARRASSGGDGKVGSDVNNLQVVVVSALATAAAYATGYWINNPNSKEGKDSSSSSSTGSPFPVHSDPEKDREAYRKYHRAADGFPLPNKDKSLVWRDDAGLSKLVPLHPTKSSSKNSKALKKYTMAEVAKRNTPEEAWIIIDERVYDITNYTSKHPGGEKVLYNMAGKDCTDAFANYHSAAIYKKWLPTYLIGEVTDVPQYEHVQDFREIRQELLRRGLFETDPSYYSKMGMWYMTLLAVALYLSLACSSKAAHLTGAVVMGLFWQQLAGTGHDIGHSSVSHNFQQDNYYGALYGTALMGISVGWWKRSHNVHHIVCNSIEHDCDIQHMPFLAVTPEILKKPFWSTYHNKVIFVDGAAKFFLKHQHILFPLVMALARFNLYVQSYILLLTTDNKKAIVMNYRKEEFLGMGIFFTWVGFVCCSMPTWGESLQWLLISHAFTALLHVQICLSHFSMETYHGNAYNTKDDEWYTMQIKTTMNVDCYEWNDWFHIGLQYQIEHHLFPTLPRHNLPIAKKMVKEVCKKHGIRYHEVTFWQGIKETLACLKATAMEVRAGKYDYETSSAHIRDLMNAHG